MYDDDKELATDKLLEVLRRDKVEPEVEEEEISVPLSEEEEDAILSSGFEEKNKIEKKKKYNISENFVNYSTLLKQRLKKFATAKSGFIGLDIGSNNIKYVILNKSKKEMVLEDYGIYTYRRGELAGEKLQEEIINVLNLILDVDRRKSNYIISSVYGQNVAIKNVILPKVAKKELRDAIIWNAKKDLPFPVEDSLVDYKILGEISEKGVPKYNSIVAIADEELVRSHLNILKSLEMIPYRVIVEPLAIYNTFSSFVRKRGLKDGVIIDIGASATYMIFIADSHLQFVREIAIGGEDITQGLIGSIPTNEGTLEIDRDYAEKLKFEIGIPESDDFTLLKGGISGSQIDSLIKPILEKLIIQIQRTLDYYRGKFQFGEPEKIYISGGTVKLKRFTEFLSESLEKEINILNPMELVKIGDNLNKKDLEEVAPFLTVAFGTAIDTKEGLNLLPPDIKILPLIALQKRIFRLALIFVIVALTFFSIIAYNGSSEFEKRLEEISRYGSSAPPIIKEYLDLTKQKTAIETEKNNFFSQISSLTESADIVGVLKILSNITPEYITINDINISSIDVKISGYINDNNFNSEMFLADFTVRLENTGFFSKVNPYSGVSPEGGSERFHFEITCNL